MLNALMAAPALVKVLGTLAAILLVNRFSRQLILSIGVGALVLAAWSGQAPTDMVRIASERLSSLDTLLLLVVICQVIWLSSQMGATGVMEDLLSTVRSLVSPRTAMAVLPAVIGLLPMPGGALFSAPLVDSCDAEAEVAPELKAQINHWFRHIWEYWWPLYPGVLLAMQITGLQVWHFIVFGIPFTLSSITAGRVFLLAKVARGERDPGHSGRGTALLRLLKLLLPILAVIACYAAIAGGYALVTRGRPDAPPLNGRLPILIGLVAAMLTLQLERPLARAEWRLIIFSRRALNMCAIVAMVLVYGAFIRAGLPGGRTLVDQMHAEMAAWGIPALAITMLLPLIAGLSTGVALGFVGAAFPIVMGLMGEDVDLSTRIATTGLAYAWGHMGQMLSPVHVCLVVTSEHFRTQVLRNAAGLVKPACLLLAVSVLVYFVLV
jgi:hypothetical protein